MANPGEVDGILEAGADRLKPMAEATMAEVKREDGPALGPVPGALPPS